MGLSWKTREKIGRILNGIGKLFYYSVAIISIVWWLSLTWPNTFLWLVRF